MVKIVASEPPIVEERVQPILDLGANIRRFWQDIRWSATRKFVMANAADITDTARRLKELPYISGAFPELLEVIARAFETPNDPRRYNRVICTYLAETIEAAARRMDITSAYVSARVEGLHELAMQNGIEISADYI